MGKTFNFLCLIYSLFVSQHGLAERTKEKIYVDVAGHGACFRRFNGTNQIGCSSGRKGSVGVVHYVQTDSDKDWLINTGPHDPYTALLTPQMFQKDVVMQLVNSDKVSGILAINQDAVDYPTEFSADHSCPNSQEGFYSSDRGDPQYSHCKPTLWNSPGSSLFYEDIDIPILVLDNSTEIEELITNCYEKHNEPTGGTARDYPLCAAELKDAMDGAVDTPTCIRRSNLVTNLNPQVYCDPLGDFNVFAPMQPIYSTNTLGEKSLIIGAARLDSLSMFENHYPSADLVISGIVTLLAAAKELGKVQYDFEGAQHQLLLMFFNGEAFDYMGSGKVVYDMRNDAFPAKLSEGEIGPHNIKVENIKSFVEISQVGRTIEDKLWIHTDPVSRGDSTVNSTVADIISEIQGSAAGANLTIDTVGENKPLPPASFQSFLKEADIAGVVITDHETTYTNKYYNSIYDTAANINADYPDNIPEDDKYDYVTDAAAHLTKVAQVTAETLYKLSTGNDPGNKINVNETHVANLLYCFSYSPTCPLFNFTIDPTFAKTHTENDFHFYVSIGGTMNYPTHMAYQLLSYYLGNKTDLSADLCHEYKDGDDVDYEKCCKSLAAHVVGDKLHNYVYLQGSKDPNDPESYIGECYRSTANVTVAQSPAFEIEGYDFESNEYPAWTESRWATDAIYVRYFLIPPKGQEIGVLCFSLILFVLCLIGSYFLEKKAKLIFAAKRNILCECYDGADMTTYGSTVNANGSTNSSGSNQVTPVTT